MIGIFYIVRGIFIVLTPFGNPPMFNGSYPLFHGFANYELGVYPSGHAGNVFLILLLVKDNALQMDYRDMPDYRYPDIVPGSQPLQH